MKIAVCGTHWTGKTTLAEELSQVLSGYSFLEEPYSSLEEEGHEFPAELGLEDFELQIEYAIQQISDSGDKVVFDRCPADLLAYILTCPDSGYFDFDSWLPRIQDAMAQLNLLIFVPIEEPDLLECPDWADPDLRIRVDEVLHDSIPENHWDFDMEVLEVRGTPSERLRQVLGYLKNI